MLQKLFVFILLFVTFAGVATAQNERQRVPPPEVRETNVLVSKRMWRIIDLRERQNKIASWPGNPLQKILYNSLASGQLIPYRDDSLKTPIPFEQFVKMGTQKDLIKRLYDINDDDRYYMDTVITPFDPVDRIQHLMIMEDWYFDNRYGMERAQIIAIAPLFQFIVDGVDLGLQPLCWIRYHDRLVKEPDARKVLVKQYMFNAQNSRSTFSYDDWFEQRRFSSFVVKESNMHDAFIMDDHDVKRDGVKALLRADRIRMLNQSRESDVFEN